MAKDFRDDSSNGSGEGQQRRRSGGKQDCRENGSNGNGEGREQSRAAEQWHKRERERRRASERTGVTSAEEGSTDAV